MSYELTDEELAAYEAALAEINAGDGALDACEITEETEGGADED